MIVGLTGGIGSGKTWVSSLFKDLGVPVYISDEEAKKLMHTNEQVKQAIIELFGDEAYINKKLNRDFISQRVFVNKDLLNQLNAIVHPAVAIHFKDWYKQQTSPFVIKESAILFEIGGDKKCDQVILVTAPVSERIRRVQLRDNASAEAIQRRIDSQWTDEKKIPLANYVIENVEKPSTVAQVNAIYKRITEIVLKC